MLKSNRKIRQYFSPTIILSVILSSIGMCANAYAGQYFCVTSGYLHLDNLRENAEPKYRAMSDGLERVKGDGSGFSLEFSLKTGIAKTKALQKLSNGKTLEHLREGQVTFHNNQTINIAFDDVSGPMNFDGKGNSSAGYFFLFKDTGEFFISGMTAVKFDGRYQKGGYFGGGKCNEL